MTMVFDMPFWDLLNVACKFAIHQVNQMLMTTRTTAVVDTKYGKVRGRQRRTFYKEQFYFAFEGIPYGKPPIGELRFRAPQPPDPWEGIRDCTQTKNCPVQFNSVLHYVEGSEDCLYLNVYTKHLKSEKPLPVIVWIYGGAFQVGEATKNVHGPDHFMIKDVILITFNFRVGALGFLKLSDPESNVPGNAGLKDQISLLHWIKENIANFNGDPNNVTVVGFSSGAMCVNVLMNAERARGLFHKAIMLSGSSLFQWCTQTEANWAYRLACALGYKGEDNDKDVLRYLQKASPKDIMGVHQLYNEDEFHKMNTFAFVPCIEPYLTEDCVISKPHVQSFASAWGNAIPLILGTTRNEDFFVYTMVKRDYNHFAKDFYTCIPNEVRDAATLEELEEYVRRLKQFAFNDVNTDKMNFMECLLFQGTKCLTHPIHRFTLARRAYASTTYRYRFDYESRDYNIIRNLLCGPDSRGVCHGDDLYFMFHNILSVDMDKSSPESQVTENIIELWTSFATYGDPNFGIAAPIKWEPMDRNGPIKCMNLNRRLSIIDYPEQDLFELYDSFYEKLKLY